MAQLLAEAGAAPLDYLKVGPFQGPEAIAALARHHPLMLHLDDALSAPGPFDDAHLARLSDLVRLTGTPWTSEHIGFGVAQVGLDGNLVTQPRSPLLEPGEALESIVRNAGTLTSRLPVPLLLENIPFFPNLAHVTVCEPGFVSAVIARSGCDLLLDLAHARVTASVLRLDVHEYLERLPLAQTVEIHLSGPRRLVECAPRLQAVVRENAYSVRHLLAFDDDCLVDAHEPLRDEDYALLEWTLTRARPAAVTLEYYREPDALRAQLLRLGEMLGR
jgi:uncharacterized protein (UPF0276 family)